MIQTVVGNEAGCGTPLAISGVVAMASAVYRPRRPEQGELHQLIRDYFETFRAQAAAMRDGQGLPRFVEREFRARVVARSASHGGELNAAARTFQPPGRGLHSIYRRPRRVDSQYLANISGVWG